MTCPSAVTASPASSWRWRRTLPTTPIPSDADIDRAMINICRCGTYPRMRSAIHRASELATDAMA